MEGQEVEIFYGGIIILSPSKSLLQADRYGIIHHEKVQEYPPQSQSLDSLIRILAERRPRT